jgi:hypothetical protein
MNRDFSLYLHFDQANTTMDAKINNGATKEILDEESTK